MKLIKFSAGSSLDEAYVKLQENAPCYGDFNDRILYSSDSLDEIFIKVTGKTKSEFDEHVRQEQEIYEKEKAEFKSSIPQLTVEYRKRARGIIPQEHLEYWDEIVPIRIEDMYRGMELDCWLDMISVLNDEGIPKEERMEKCLHLFSEQNHSGASASLVFCGLCKFHSLGPDLVDYICNNIG